MASHQLHFHLLYKKGLQENTNSLRYLFFNIRIHSILFLWLSLYWNDFNSSYSREYVIQFIDEISKFENYTPICDSLAPLIIREPPHDDPDKSWGFIDDEDTNASIQSTSPSHRPRNEKKDSGYASGTFSIHIGSSSPLASPKDEQFMLKRTSNTSNNSCKAASPTTLSTSVCRSARNSSFRQAIRHSGSQPNLRTFFALGVDAIPDKESDVLPGRAEFAGGIINIDNTLNHRKNINSNASTILGSRWASSFGRQTASSFMSSLRADNTDSYKYLVKLSDKEISEQLTWIEAELFFRIEVHIISCLVLYVIISPNDCFIAKRISSKCLD